MITDHRFTTHYDDDTSQCKYRAVRKIALGVTVREPYCLRPREEHQDG